MTKMPAPKCGVTIRMYRQGHGDCFLLAFRRAPDRDDPYYVLIDCGMKKGSQPIEDKKLSDTIKHIAKATGGILDLVIVTHEHEDHVSGFPKPDDDTHPFRALLKVRELWLAWTENAEDDLANELREAYGDKLLTLALAHEKLSRLSGVASKEMADMVGEFLETETGHNCGRAVLGEARDMMGLDDGAPEASYTQALGAKIRGKRYKERLQGLRRMAGSNIRFLRPDEGPVNLPGVEGVRIYPFGPPRDRVQLRRLNPRSAEEFHMGPFALDAPGAGLFSAFSGDAQTGGTAPFAPRYSIPEDSILSGPRKRRDPDRHFLTQTYRNPAEENRRIDGDWLDEAEPLALRLNSEVNNTSLVLMFELIASGQTLLFTGDAQAGSWRSWAGLSWRVDGTQVTSRDLMGRCTFYKVGHHGSHNATLNGTLTDSHPNLSWMAKGDYAAQFTAMIPANKAWAYGKSRPWKHPMKEIETALLEKAENRVLTLHSDDKAPEAPENTAQAKAMWRAFQARVRRDDAFVELDVFDALD